MVEQKKSDLKFNLFYFLKNLVKIYFKFRKVSMNKRKIYFFIPNDMKKNTPIDSRIKAFSDFFSNREISVIKKTLTFNDILRSFNTKSYIFLSMPPFRCFWLFFIPSIKIILDIRDGWSIAQKTGYGGNVKNKPFKAKISRVIERFIIRRSFLSITCTPGLQEYLSKLSGRNLLLIPNGINDEDSELVDSLKVRKIGVKDSDQLVFCCAGKFSEAGKKHIKALLSTISNRYKTKKLIIKLIGSDPEENKWVIDFFHLMTKGRGKVTILKRMDKEELFTAMMTSDFGLTVVRDPSYEFGTKIYDYIALGLPVVNYFDEPNAFTDYFDFYLDVTFNKHAKIPVIKRSLLIKNALSSYF